MKTIFLHGLGQAPQDWQEVLALTPATDYECSALFAPSDSPPTYHKIMDMLAQRYGGSTEPLRLCGLSLGAVLALDFAARHPEGIVSLLLIAPQYKVSRPLLLLQDFLFHLMPDSSFAGFGLSKQAVLCLTHSMRSLDLTPQLDCIRCPVTILCGANDRSNLHAAKKLAALLPQAELHILPHTGHEVNKTAPQAIAAYLI